KVFDDLIHDRSVNSRVTLTEALQRHDRADLAASMQQALEQYVLRLAEGATNVCLGGGVAWNAVLVSALERRFKGVFSQPAAGNAGTALGAALYAWHGVAAQSKRLDAGSYYLGPDFTVQ